ncbi:hypothetical protein SGPA1_40477 [Streptomyces misionensis JCM 4497]
MHGRWRTARRGADGAGRQRGRGVRLPQPARGRRRHLHRGVQDQLPAGGHLGPGARHGPPAAPRRHAHRGPDRAARRPGPAGRADHADADRAARAGRLRQDRGGPDRAGRRGPALRRGRGSAFVRARGIDMNLCPLRGFVREVAWFFVVSSASVHAQQSAMTRGELFRRAKTPTPCAVAGLGAAGAGDRLGGHRAGRPGARRGRRHRRRTGSGPQQCQLAEPGLRQGHRWRTRGLPGTRRRPRQQGLRPLRPDRLGAGRLLGRQPRGRHPAVHHVGAPHRRLRPVRVRRPRHPGGLQRGHRRPRGHGDPAGVGDVPRGGRALRRARQLLHRHGLPALDHGRRRPHLLLRPRRRLHDPRRTAHGARRLPVRWSTAAPGRSVGLAERSGRHRDRA